MNFGFTIRILLIVTIALGIFTVLTIRLFVPSFIVDSAIGILILYVLALVWLVYRKSKGAVALIAALSVFTIAATFSSTAHLQLIEEGYIPAIVIIFGGLLTQGILFVLCVLELGRKTV